MMKNLKRLTTFIAASLILLATSCSQDQSIADENPSIENIESISSKASKSSNEVTILLEWHAGVSKTQKKNIREYYKDNGVLIKYLLCTQSDFEEWTLNCASGTCSRQSDTPVETDDDVKRLHFLVTCKDL